MPRFIALLLLLACLVGGAIYWNATGSFGFIGEPGIADLSSLPAYEDYQTPYVIVNGNRPYFKGSDYTATDMVPCTIKKAQTKYCRNMNTNISKSGHHNLRQWHANKELLLCG